jgi:glutamine synthetase
MRPSQPQGLPGRLMPLAIAETTAPTPFAFQNLIGLSFGYLLPAALIAAGLDGITQKRAPGPRYDNNAYTDPLPAGTLKALPMNLLDALRSLESSSVFSERLGEPLVSAYLKLKHQEWRNYSGTISPWELENTLDC